MTTEKPAVVPFPRVFWVAIGLEVLERLAFYGVYVNLSVYLTDNVHMSPTEGGLLLGWFAASRAWAPVATGALSDRIGFKKSLLVSFALYIVAYSLLAGLPSRVGAWIAVLSVGLAGSFLKPVIPAATRRYSPEGRHTTGFSIFYGSVNAGSVIGKVGAKLVRSAVSLRATMINPIIACVIAFFVTLLFFHEPAPAEQTEAADVKKSAEKAPPRPSFLASLREAGSDVPFVVFLVLVSGYYLLIEQFYQTFPVHIVRTLGKQAPREYITLINPLAIALFQVFVGRLTKRIPPLIAMPLGILIGAGSMLLMGAFPTLLGACASFFVFAIAEMVYSPRYYEYISSFAPKGREGLYMGLAFVPFGVGGLIGGVLSGRLIAAYLPESGPIRPFTVWGTYAAIGVGCAAVLFVFGLATRRRRELGSA